MGLSGHDPFVGVNAGFIALCCNCVVVIAVSKVFPSSHFSFNVDSATSSKKAALAAK
jgi:hypothetical protein